MGPAIAIVVGLAIVAAYVALGVWAVRATWSWSSKIDGQWARIVLASSVATVFFMPGIVGAGHGVGIGPAWLMFATGTFGALTSASKLKALVGIMVGWAIALSIGFLIAGVKAKKWSPLTGDDNPFH